jgi:wyosine [tRNA(Phe)-imidazoG37] synthetase (radical SAM superfamily)
MNHHFLFGPVPSRRLGMSLGIDLIPKKICTLNCVYCEVGKTTCLTTTRAEYIPVDGLLAELDDFMVHHQSPDYITFSGSGEPTLNSRLGEVLDVIHIKYPGVRTAVLTNGTLLHDPGVRGEIVGADVILPSLDAASDHVFRRINRPKSSLSIESHLRGLEALRKEYHKQLWLEIFFLRGYNDHLEELILLEEAIERIEPDRVQLNTLDRPGTVPGLKPLSQQELMDIIEFWEMDHVEIIASPVERQDQEAFQGEIMSGILETLQRRPCTLDDLEQWLGIHRNEINKYLGVLENQQKITTQILPRGVFYELWNK